MGARRRVWGAAALAAALAAGAGGQEERAAGPEAWRGPWVVEGRATFRYVWIDDGRLAFEGEWDDLGRLDLRGRGRVRGGFVLEGRRRRGAPGERLTLEAAPADGGRSRLAVTLAAGEAVLAEEVWLRPGPPRLEVERVRPTGSGGWVVDVAVRGRPQPVVLEVLAAEDDARYAGLGGVVHHARLADGAPLPIGRYRVEWDGRDRSWAARPVRSGRYRVRVHAPEPLGPPPGAEGDAAAGAAGLAFAVAEAGGARPTRGVEAVVREAGPR